VDSSRDADLSAVIPRGAATAVFLPNVTVGRDTTMWPIGVVSERPLCETMPGKAGRPPCHDKSTDYSRIGDNVPNARNPGKEYNLAMVSKLARVGLMLTGCSALASSATGQVTFHKDIEPLLQAHCQVCHRPGEIGPMSLLTYQNTRPWAKAVKQAVLTRKMPPWFADSSVQHYNNDASLSTKEIETITSWVDAGAPEGDVNDAPSPRSFVEGWSIGRPDLIVEMPERYRVPARGTIEYTYVILPTHFTEDRWVVAAEIRPGNRAVMHMRLFTSVRPAPNGYTNTLRECRSYRLGEVR
jgi:hypothetical protein